MRLGIWMSALLVFVLALAGILMGRTITTQIRLPTFAEPAATRLGIAFSVRVPGWNSPLLDVAWKEGDRMENSTLVGDENEHTNPENHDLLTANNSLAIHRSEEKFDVLNSSMASTTSNDLSVASYRIVEKSAVDYEERGGSCLTGQFCNRFGRQCEFRVDTLPELAEMTNFSTILTLQNIKLLVLGDSVGMQFFHLLDVATGGNVTDRTVLENAFWDHISRGLSSTKKVGAWRTTGMLLPENENRPPPNHPGGGWNRTMAELLLNLPGEDGQPIGSFDVLVFRIPHGWLELGQITNEAIKMSLRMAANLFGVKKVILLTLPFNNNVQPEHVSRWLRKNEDIFQLANNFESNKTVPGIDRLVVMDMAQFMDSLIETNVRHLPYLNHSTNMTHLHLRVKERIAKKDQSSKPAAAHVCSGPIVSKPNGLESCDRNIITSDGMHFCLSITGGRFVAATGCLLNCLYNPTGITITGCQHECNNRFMNLNHVA